MEGALVSAATGALKPVVDKLTALLGEEYKRFKRVPGQIEFLTKELASMHAFLLKMSEEEEEGHDAQDKLWMKEVRELSYDMEDSIDEFMQRVHNKDVKPDGLFDKIKHSLGKLKTRRRIGKEIEDLKKQIIDVAERNARYKTREDFSKTRNATVDPRALAVFEHVSRLVGIYEPKAEIIKLLMEEDGCSTQQLKVVSVVGSGGMGKTTLVNQVYQELKGLFQCGAFVSVSRSPDVVNILRIILSEVSDQSYAHTEAGSIQHLIRKSHDFLKDKRFLIVVDDIWEVKTWEIIKHAFPVTSNGSRIISTTRVKDVATSCCSSFPGYVYHIKPLSMEYSRKLFHGRLFSPEDHCPSHLQEVSDEILEKCDGLPLAIIAISGLLANKKNTKDQWDQVKNSIGCALERNPSVEGMLKILSLSYFDLPPHLKTCLLYLSMFPEDYVIEKDRLIRSWIVEGFICGEVNYTLYELGERCFNELINRSLIQPVAYYAGWNGSVAACRVHDTILDFIISKSLEENFVTLVGVPKQTIGTQGKVRRISRQVGEVENSVPMKGLILSHVRSLNLFRWGETDSLDGFTHLRVLNCEDCDDLEDHHLANIGVLFQLRYLNLKSTRVCQLPNQIGDLLCLEMLDLRATNVGELPASLVNLRNLVDLLVDNGVKFPDGIAKMQALQLLETVGVSKQSSSFLQELGQLKNLRKVHLDFKGVCATQDENGVTKEGMKAIVSSLQNLRTLYIENDDSLLLEAFYPLLSIQKLRVWGLDIASVPNSMGSLVNLQELFLLMGGVSQEELCILGGLPVLLKLRLQIETKCNDSRGNSVTVSGEEGFQCLRLFHYIVRRDGMDLMFAIGSMPKLEKLVIEFDAGKTESLNGGGFEFGIENLPCLTTLVCGTWGASVGAAKAAMERAANTHPNHPTLRF